MPFVTANPNEYLVIGSAGRVVNRGTGIQVFLWPGSTYVLIPSTKQEASFEMTQETQDGIPLHFKGIAIYRIVHPEMAAVNFNFNKKSGVDEINALIRNICLGELRAVVSGMTMQECVEQRKTILTTTVETELKKVVMADGVASSPQWGIELEMVQVAQVYIIDNDLRKQLEAEVRNDIRAKSDQSNIHTQEEIRLAQLASDRRIQEQKLVSEKDALRQREEIETANLQYQLRIQEQKTVAEKDALRQQEEIETANLQYQLRIQKENQDIALEAIKMATDKFKLEQDSERQKIETEAPIRLFQIEQERAIKENQLALIQIENQVHDIEVMRDTAYEKVRHELRKEIMPLEQTPAIAESLSRIFQGADLTYFGSENKIIESILPIFDIFSKMVSQKMTVDAQVKDSSKDGG